MDTTHRNEEVAAKGGDDCDNGLGESKDDPAVADVLHFAHAVDHGQVRNASVVTAVAADQKALLAMLALATAHIYEVDGLFAPGDLELYPLHPER